MNDSLSEQMLEAVCLLLLATSDDVLPIYYLFYYFMVHSLNLITFSLDQTIKT